jgi:hypothetical protein
LSSPASFVAECFDRCPGELLGTNAGSVLRLTAAVSSFCIGAFSADFGNAATTGGPLWATTFLAGQVIALDPAGPLFTQIGSGNLRAYADTDAVGHSATGN